MADTERKERNIELSAIGDEEEAVAVPLVGPDSKDAVLRIRNIHKTYLLGIEGVPALRGVSLSVKRAEIVMVLGKSGCGKTSLLNVCGTIDRPTRGDLMLCHERVTSETADAALAALRLRHISFVFQTFNLLPTMTAVENVELPMVLMGKLSTSERRARARELLSRVGMGHRLDHVPAQLSGGEQQRVTIARALANRPELLLLDEPTGDLDSRNGDIVMKLLTDLNELEGVSMVMVTHDVGLKPLAHRVVHMLDGKVQRIETTPELARQEYLRQLRVRVAGPAKGAEEEAAGPRRAPSSLAECRFTTVRQPSAYRGITRRPRRARGPLMVSPEAADEGDGAGAGAGAEAEGLVGVPGLRMSAGSGAGSGEGEGDGDGDGAVGVDKLMRPARMRSRGDYESLPPEV